MEPSPGHELDMQARYTSYDIYREKDDIGEDIYREKDDIGEDIYREKDNIGEDIYREKDEIGDEEDISVNDDGEWMFHDIRLVVKDMNTRVISYPDLVNIELSSSLESLTDLHSNNRQLGFCSNNHMMTKSDNNINKTDEIRENIYATNSCPDLVNIGSSHENVTDASRVIYSRTNSENNTSTCVKDKNNDACVDFNDESQSFDCANFLLLLKSLSMQKCKGANTFGNASKTTENNTDGKEDTSSIKKEKFADLFKIQEVVNKWKKKIKKVNLMHLTPEEWGIELADVVGDACTMEEINNIEKNRNIKFVGCMPSIFPFPLNT